jgi:hypothetical protein
MWHSWNTPHTEYQAGPWITVISCSLWSRIQFSWSWHLRCLQLHAESLPTHRQPCYSLRPVVAIVSSLARASSKFIISMAYCIQQLESRHFAGKKLSRLSRDALVSLLCFDLCRLIHNPLYALSLQVCQSIRRCRPRCVKKTCKFGYGIITSLSKMPVKHRLHCWFCMCRYICI